MAAIGVVAHSPASPSPRFPASPRPPTTSAFFCEKWRAVDLDISLAVSSLLVQAAARRGVVVEPWVGTDKDTDATGMSTGVVNSSLFIIVLANGTLRGRGVQHEVAVALEAGKPVLVLYDATSHSLDELIEQAAGPSGDPVINYKTIEATGKLTQLRSWMHTTAQPLPCRFDASFEEELPGIVNRVLDVLMTVAPIEAPAEATPIDMTSRPALRPFRMRTLRPESCDGLFVFAPDTVLSARNMLRAAVRAVGRRSLVLAELPLDASEADAKDAALHAPVLVVFLSRGLWAFRGGIAAVGAALAAGRAIVAFNEDDFYTPSPLVRSASAETPEELRGLYAATKSWIVQREVSQRSAQLKDVLLPRLGAVPAEADALGPPCLPADSMESVFAGPRSAIVSCLLEGGSSAAATAAAAPAGPPHAPLTAVALCGSGGAGKTTVAAAAATHPDVVDAFDDVVWVVLGQSLGPGRLLETLHGVIAAVDPSSFGGALPATLEAASQRLHDVCARRRVLLVVDDVWDAETLLPFVGASGSSASEHHTACSVVLFTTREAVEFATAVVSRGGPPGGVCVPIAVAPLSEAAALEFLGATAALTRPLPDAAANALLGAVKSLLPLSLVLLGACIRGHVATSEESDSAMAEEGAASDITLRLAAIDAVSDRRPGPPDQRGPWLGSSDFVVALCNSNPDAMRCYEHIYRLIELWLGMQSEGNKAKFSMLGLLPPDATVEEPVLEAVWNEKRPRVHALLNEMQDAGMLKWDKATHGVLLHDLPRDFAHAMRAVMPGGIAKGHDTLLGRTWIAAAIAHLPVAPRAARPWWLAAARGDALGAYVTERIVGHLVSAGLCDEAQDLLLQLPWLQAAFDLRWHGGFAALLGDIALVRHARAAVGDGYAAAGAAALDALASAIMLSSRALLQADPGRQLPGQLFARLSSFCQRAAPPVVALLGPLLGMCRTWMAACTVPGLQFQSSRLEGPDGARGTMMRAHRGEVSAIVVLDEPHAGLVVTAGTALTDVVGKEWQRPSLSLWDLASTAPKRTFATDLDESVLAVAVLPDGRIVTGSDGLPLRNTSGRVKSASFSKVLRVWQPATGVCDAVLEGHTSRVMHLLVLRARQILVSGSDDCSLCVWDLHALRAGAQVAPLQVLGGAGRHTRCISGITPMPDGTHIVSASYDGTLGVWEPGATSEPICFLSDADAPSALMTCVIVLPDGGVVSGATDGWMRVWRDVIRAEPTTPPLRLQRPSRLHPRHGGCVNGIAVIADDAVVSWSNDSTARVWRFTLAGAECVRELVGHSNPVICAAWLPRTRLLVTGSSGDAGQLRVWSLDAEDSCVGSYSGLSRVTRLAVLADERVVTGTDEGSLCVWTIKPREPGAVVPHHHSAVTGLVALPDGTVVSGSGDHTLRVWGPDGVYLRTLEGHVGRVRCLVSLGDGRIMSGSSDGSRRVWNVHGGGEPLVLSQVGDVACLALLSDGSVASGGRDCAVRIWRPRTGTDSVLQGLGNEHKGAVLCVAELRPGWLLSGAKDRRLLLWNTVAFRSKPQVLGTHESPVARVVVNAAGKVAVAALQDGTLTFYAFVWDASSRLKSVSPVVRLGTCGSLVCDLDFISGGGEEEILVTASNDDSLRMWRLSAGGTHRDTPCATFPFSGARRARVLRGLAGIKIALGSFDRTVDIVEVDIAAVAFEGPTTPAAPLTLLASVSLDSAVSAVVELSEGRVVVGCDDGGVHFLGVSGVPIA